MLSHQLTKIKQGKRRVCVCFYCCCLLICWLGFLFVCLFVCWLVGWLVGCLVGWLVGCLVGWLVGFFGWLVGWLFGWFWCWLDAWFVVWVFFLLFVCLFVCFTTYLPLNAWNSWDELCWLVFIPKLLLNPRLQKWGWLPHPPPYRFIFRPAKTLNSTIVVGLSFPVILKQKIFTTLPWGRGRVGCQS